MLIAEGAPGPAGAPSRVGHRVVEIRALQIANTSEAIFSSTLALELADLSGVDVAGDVEIVELGLDSVCSTNSSVGPTGPEVFQRQLLEQLVDLLSTELGEFQIPRR